MISELEEIKINQLVHEIKNPLSICSGYLEMLPKTNKKNRNKYLSIIKEELQKSIQIIKEVNTQENTLNKTTFNLNSLLKDIKELYNDLLIKNNSNIKSFTNNIMITADYNKLRQVFINLIKNSLEAKNKEQLTINIKAFKDQKKCRIYISDNGKGMTSKELKSLFIPFYTNKENGTGLGTINIKEIIRLHDGSIEYLSLPNKGTTVIIKLPLNASNNN